MKLESVEFVFPEYKVVFIGQSIAIYQSCGKHRGETEWAKLYQRNNPWTGKGRETDGVANRAFKPNVTGARDILASYGLGRKKMATT